MMYHLKGFSLLNINPRLPLRLSKSSVILNLGWRIRNSTPHPLYSTHSETEKKPDLRSQLPVSSLPLSELVSRLPNSSTQTKPKRSLRPYIYAVLLFLAGSMAGNFACAIITPLPPPEPNTPQDRNMIEFIEKEAGKIPLLKLLSSDPVWISIPVYRQSSEDVKARRLTTGPLAGSRGLGGYQRIFSNSKTGEIVQIIWFGAALAGWPGVTHGGLIATVMDETLGRCAFNFIEGNTGVTAHLELSYLKPVMTNNFYVIRAMPLIEEGKKSHSRKQWVSGRVETVDGMKCVEGKGLFVLPKTNYLKSTNT